MYDKLNDDNLKIAKTFYGQSNLDKLIEKIKNKKPSELLLEFEIGSKNSIDFSILVNDEGDFLCAYDTENCSETRTKI